MNYHYVYIVKAMTDNTAAYIANAFARFGKVHMEGMEFISKSEATGKTYNGVIVPIECTNPDKNPLIQSIYASAAGQFKLTHARGFYWVKAGRPKQGRITAAIPVSCMPVCDPRSEIAQQLKVDYVFGYEAPRDEMDDLCASMAGGMKIKRTSVATSDDMDALCAGVRGIDVNRKTVEPMFKEFNMNSTAECMVAVSRMNELKNEADDGDVLSLMAYEEYVTKFNQYYDEYMMEVPNRNHYIVEAVFGQQL